MAKGLLKDIVNVALGWTTGGYYTVAKVAYDSSKAGKLVYGSSTLDAMNKHAYTMEGQEAVAKSAVQGLGGTRPTSDGSEEAMKKKKELFGEQESERAGLPNKRSYLGSTGVEGGYVDAEELQKKKRLGGNKEGTGSSGTMG